MPGGVNSPVRAFTAVGGEPLFIARGEGAYIIDADGRRYLDLVGAFGPLILGHAHPSVVEALQRQASRGTAYGMPTEAETELAELIVQYVPSVEMVRLVNSGTEATMSAVRLARASTGRDLLVKFSGGYHGHSDYLLADAGSGVAALGIPSSPGVPAAAVALTAVLPYNDCHAAEKIFAQRGAEIAAVIVEPIAGNMGVVPGTAAFLTALRRLCDERGAVLIFDEVITGFRVGIGGAQQLLGINPDLTCLGKVIGGGLPLAAYGGRAELMGRIAPEGSVYQAGTLSGNPLAVTAGIATLRALLDDPPYARLEAIGAALESCITVAAASAGTPVRVNRVGSMLTPFFTEASVTNFESARSSDAARYARFFHGLLDHGVLVPPSKFETWFMSTAIGAEEEALLRGAVEAAFATLARN
jgi:glutamate-1-semialdehyde 2,1-aminomutase